MDASCPAGLLADMRERLEKQWRDEVGNPKSRDKIVKINVLLGLLDLWEHSHTDAEVLSRVSTYLKETATWAATQPAFTSSDARDIIRQRALYRAHGWTIDQRFWICDQQLAAIPYPQRVEAGVEVLNRVFPLWPFMVRRAWCRQGKDLLEQVFRYRGLDNGAEVLSRVYALVGVKPGPGGYQHWWFEARALHNPGHEDRAVKRQLALAQGRLWWRAARLQRAKLLAEHGGPPPRNLQPPIPVRTHDYRGLSICWVCTVGWIRASIAVPAHLFKGDGEDVIPGDILIENCFGMDTRWKIQRVAYNKGSADGGIWSADIELMPWPVK